MFSKLSFEEGYSWGLNIKNGNYFDLFHFFEKTYGRYYMKEFKEYKKNISYIINRIKEYYINKTIDNKLIIEIEEILCDKNSSPIFLGLIEPDLFLIKKIFEFPEKVIEERKNKNDILGVLLSK